MQRVYLVSPSSIQVIENLFCTRCPALAATRGGEAESSTQPAGEHSEQGCPAGRADYRLAVTGKSSQLATWEVKSGTAAREPGLVEGLQCRGTVCHRWSFWTGSVGEGPMEVAVGRWGLLVLCGHWNCLHFPQLNGNSDPLQWTESSRKSISYKTVC